MPKTDWHWAGFALRDAADKDRTVLLLDRQGPALQTPDARKIANAPRMLDMLERCLEFLEETDFEEGSEDDALMGEIRHVLAKARGDA